MSTKHKYELEVYMKILKITYKFTLIEQTKKSSNVSHI